MSKYSFFLSKTKSSWRPEYVRNQSNFSNKIKEYRTLWRASTNAASRNSIERNFKRNYSEWLIKVKKANTDLRREHQKFLNNIRSAKNKNAVLGKYNRPQSAPARVEVPRSARRVQKPKSLLRSIHNTLLLKMKNNLREKIRNLESKRDNLEKQIGLVLDELRSLPY